MKANKKKLQKKTDRNPVHMSQQPSSAHQNLALALAQVEAPQPTLLHLAVEATSKQRTEETCPFQIAIRGSEVESYTPLVGDDPEARSPYTGLTARSHILI
jgi:hypothetical protein